MARAASDFIELADISPEEYTDMRGAVRSENKGLEFSEIERLIRKRSSGIKRAPGKTDSFEGWAAAIAEKYVAQLSGLAPVPDPRVLEEYVEIKDGVIYMIGGQSFSVTSPEGIVAIEILNRVVNGEEMEAVVSEVQAEIEKIALSGGKGTDVRGLYIDPQNAWPFDGFFSGSRWPGGVVRFDLDIKDEYIESPTPPTNLPPGMTRPPPPPPFRRLGRTTALNAMRAWSEATGGKIKFQEVDGNFLQQFLRILGQYPYVTIKYDSSLPSGTAGRSPVGAAAWSVIRINPANAEVERTYLHEIGHTLGLMHEHQRHDRDNYVSIPSEKLNDKTNYGKVPKSSFVIGLKPVKIIFFTIYIPWIWYVDYGIAVGNFDFDSIMIYDSNSGIMKKPGNVSFTRKDVLSPTDAATVRRMY